MEMDPKERPYFAPPTEQWTPKLHQLRERDGLGQTDPGEAAHALAEEAGLGMFDQTDPQKTEREDQLIRALEQDRKDIASLRRAIKWLVIAVMLLSGSFLIDVIGRYLP